MPDPAAKERRCVMDVLAMALAVALQAQDGAAALPDSLAINERFDCEVNAAHLPGDPIGPYPRGAYVFLIPAATGLTDGSQVPYVYTLADGRTFLEWATVEGPDPAFGSAYGFALRTRSGAVIAFTRRDANPPGHARLRGSYRRRDGAGEVELSGLCQTRAAPQPVSVSG
jgi:hypothetical protein